MTPHSYDDLMVTRHHTKDKGDIAVVKAIADLTCQGAAVLVPLTEHAAFDLVALLGDRFFRVQVKYRSLKGGTIGVVFESTWADRHGVHTTPMSKAEVDIVLIYCPTTDQCYYVDPREHRKAITLRIDPPRNNQRDGVHLARDHLVMPPPTAAGRPPGAAPAALVDALTRVAPRSRAPRDAPIPPKIRRGGGGGSRGR